jgi:nitrite reductase/ring-hydroxylating ferredoxin subunit
MVRLPMESTSSPKGKDRDGTKTAISFSETEIAQILQQDGCEDCIVCPLHRTAFALESGEVRGEWCPYPPVVGPMVGKIKKQTSVATFDVRTKGKLIEVRINSPLEAVEIAKTQQR